MQNYILKSLYHDSFLSYRLGLPFLVDKNILKVIEWKNQQIKNTWKFELRDIFYKIWISLNHPDYANESWEKVHKIRESKAGHDYRRMIGNIINQVLEILPEIDDKKDVENLITKLLHKEVVEELKSKLQNPVIASLKLGLNFIPYGGLVSSFKDIFDIIQDKSSWISLI